jgi:hypothetical protein
VVTTATGGHMKQLLALIFVSAFAFAQSTHAQGWQSNCKAFEHLARSIMTARQNGEDISKLIGVADDPTRADAKDLTTKLIFSAYKQPRYQTEDMQQKAIDDFSNDTYLGCVEAAAGSK